MRRRLIVVALAATLALAGLWYMGLWSPQSSSLRQARTAAAAAVKKQHTLAAEVASLQQDQSRLPALRSKLTVLNLAMPATPAVASLIDGINATSLAAGVSLVAISPTPSAVTAAAAAPDTPATINVLMSAVGTYAQIIDFVNRLDTMSRLMVVDSLTFGVPDANGRIALSMSARVFTTATG
jgi:Tfp pilus assembly protein PilO